MIKTISLWRSVVSVEAPSRSKCWESGMVSSQFSTGHSYLSFQDSGSIVEKEPDDRKASHECCFLSMICPWFLWIHNSFPSQHRAWACMIQSKMWDSNNRKCRWRRKNHCPQWYSQGWFIFGPIDSSTTILAWVGLVKHWIIKKTLKQNQKMW